MDKHFPRQTIRLFLVFWIFISSYFIMKFLLLHFYPFIIAWFLSYIIQPFVTYLEKRIEISRFFATFIVLSLIFGLIFSLSTYLITELIHGTLYLADVIPYYLKISSNWMRNFLEDQINHILYKMNLFIEFLGYEKSSLLHSTIERFHNQFTSLVIDFFQGAFIKMPRILSIVPYSFTVTIVTFISTFLITKDWPSLKSFINKRMSSSIKDVFLTLKRNLEKSLIGYIRAEAILISLTACILFIGLNLLKIEHSLTLTLFISFIDIIPLLGIGAVLVPWILYLFFTKSFSLTIGLSLLYIIIVVFRQFIEPKVFAEQVGLNPLFSLGIIFFCFQFWGISGFFFAPFLFIFISAIYHSRIIHIIFSYIKG